MYGVYTVHTVEVVLKAAHIFLGKEIFLGIISGPEGTSENTL